MIFTTYFNKKLSFTFHEQKRQNLAEEISEAIANSPMLRKKLIK